VGGASSNLTTHCLRHFHKVFNLNCCRHRCIKNCDYRVCIICYLLAALESVSEGIGIPSAKECFWV
jgi:hypothetical protein